MAALFVFVEEIQVRLRRSPLLRFRVSEHETFDPEAFLRGKLKVSVENRLEAFSVLLGHWAEITMEDLACLVALSEKEWRGIDQTEPPWNAKPDRLEDLISLGVVLSDLPEHATTLESHESLCQIGWHGSALCCFLENQRLESDMSSRTGRDDIFQKSATADGDADRFVERHGRPPEAFFDLDGSHPLTELPKGSFTDHFAGLLLRRRTCRAFSSSPLALDVVARLLDLSFGCQGLHKLGESFVSLQRTSPSGGSLHPIEAFPIVLNVAGVETGIYHYTARHHALSLVRLEPIRSLRELVVDFAQGQEFVADAHVVILMVARFERNMWKYSNRLNTYHVIWADLGHLAQTLQLVAVDHGLGAFYTGAIYPDAINEALGLNPGAFGALALCGFGNPAAHDSSRLPFEPFHPERS